MSFIKELFARFSLHEGQSKSAELAYFFLLSLFPLMIFMLTLTAYLPISAEDVLGAVDQYAPDSAMSMVKSITEQTLNKRSGGLLSFGIIAVIWSASNGMNAIVRAFNHAYEVEENRSFIIIRLTSTFFNHRDGGYDFNRIASAGVRQRNRNAGRRFHRRLRPVFAGVVGCPLGYQSAYPFNCVYRALHFRAE